MSLAPPDLVRNPIKIGDTVYLKSGSPPLHVIEFGVDCVRVSWTNGDKTEFADVPADNLADKLVNNPRIEFEERFAHAATVAAIEGGDTPIILRGGRGCAKTLSLCRILHGMALQHPGLEQTWMRWERSKMTDTVLKTFEDEILGIGNPMRKGPARDTRRGYEYPNGSKITLMGMADDIDATKSAQGDIFWVNECGQVPYNVWDEIGGAARPRIGLSPIGVKPVKIGDLNPMPPAHWTNALAEEFPRHLYPRVHDDGTDFGKAYTQEMYYEAQRYNLAKFDKTRYKHKLIQFFPPDNPGYWDFYKWDWYAEGLHYVQDQLGRMSGNLKARYLEGRPMAVEGVVFPEFDRDRNMIDTGPGHDFPNGWPSDWPVWVAYDPGFTHPCAVVFWGVAPTGQHFIVDEIHGSGIDIDILAKRIWEKVPRYRIVKWLADPRGANQKTQIAKGETVIGYMRRVHQLNFMPWKAASGKAIQDQVEAVRVIVKHPTRPLRVFSHCKGVIGEFESWKNKTNVSGELAVGDDAYENKDNDAMDAIRGIVADRPSITQSGAEVHAGGSE